MPDQPKLAALYARRSKDDPKQISIGRQKETCLAAAELHGYEIPERLIFIHEGISGAILERPGLTAILNAAHSGELAAVSTYDEDRLARNHGYAWLVGGEFKSLHVQLFIQDKPPGAPPKV